MIKALTLKLELLFRWILKNDVWAFESFLLFFAYFTMQINNKLSWSFFLASASVLNVLFFAPLLFIYFEDKLAKDLGRFQFWSIWVLAFVGLPRLVFLLFPSNGSQQILNPFKLVELGNFFSASFSYLDVLLPMLIIYFVLRFSRYQNRSGNLTKWLRSISFLRLNIIVLGFLALLLPIVSNNFQALASRMAVYEIAWVYLKAVPQIFLIYFSYYSFYYLNQRFLFPLIFEKKGVIPYIISLAGLILVLTPILNSLISLFPVIYELKIHPLGTEINVFDDINYIFPILVVLASFPVIVLIEWNKKSIAMKELEREKSNAELLLLKQQINPHFFFNTLNNLYALSLEKSDQAPDTILKLSKLMRFVIYKGQNEFVLLSEEVQYLKDYIDLQKIRVTNKLAISFKVNIEDPTQKIPPLLFINLVENAFKHGIEVSNKDGFLDINLTENSGEINFTCVNSIDDGLAEGSDSGIGIRNLQRRLEIRYPNRHSLVVEKDASMYTAKLDISLWK